MNPALLGLLTIIAGVGGCIGYFYFSNVILDKFIFPARDVAIQSALFRRRVGQFALFFVPLFLIFLISFGGASIFASIGEVNSVAFSLNSESGLRYGFVFKIAAFLAFGGMLWLIVDFLFPKSVSTAGQNINRANQVRPWLFLMPALLALGLYLGYPVFETLRLSLTDRSQDGAFVGLANYSQMIAEPKFVEAIRNNMLWLIVVPAASTAFGLLAAQLTDRIAWGAFAKSLIFMPMAISFVGASVIFKLIYDARPAGTAQIGILNAVWMNFDGGFGSTLMLKVLPVLLLIGFAAIVAYAAYAFSKPLLRSRVEEHVLMKALRVLGVIGGAWLVIKSLMSIVAVLGATHQYGVPQQWLTLPFWNNFFLMVVLIWIQTGFAMVILSAAIRGIPEETVEAAVLDGANPFQIFFKIKVPQIMGTIVVVWTTITLVVLKVFDIVFAMTNGQWETQVLANYMYDKLFVALDWGVASAAAMVIMLLVTPILVWNVYNVRKEMR